MKLVSRGDTTVVDAYLSPILRRYVEQVERDLGGARRAISAAAPVHAVERRADRCAPFPGQGRDPLGAGGRDRRRGRGFAARRIRPDHRLRHGRHVDRRHALCGRIRARVHHRGRRRAARGADDAHPHGRRRRRLDLHVRRRAVSRRPAVRRRESRPRVVPARRPADGDRLQRDGGQARPRALSSRVRPRRGSAARRGDRAREVRGARRRGRREDRPCANARGGRRRVPEDRGREHGERDQAHFGRARVRRHRVHAVLLRRRGRPARVPRRRCARNDARAAASVRRRALRLRHGARRRALAEAEGGRDAALRRGACRVRAHARRARARGARRSRRAGDRR